MKVNKISTITNAWYPDMAREDDDTVIAWREFRRDQSVQESDVIRIARLNNREASPSKKICAGHFVGEPRLIEDAEGWKVLIIRRQDNQSWALECYDVDESLNAGEHHTVSSPDESVTGFAAESTPAGPVVAWVEVGPSGRQLLTRYMDEEGTMCLDEGSVWSPTSTKCGDEVAIAWENQGSICLARLDDKLQPAAETVVDLGDRLLGYPDVDCGAEAIYMVCQSNGNWSKETERLNGDTRLHAFRWADGTVEASEGQPGGRIPVETRSRFESYRDESPENRRLPVAPRVMVDEDDTVHVIFRHYRDAQKNDWGWTLRCTTSSPAGFSPAVDVSREAGYPDGQFRMIRDDGETLLAVTETEFPVKKTGFTKRDGVGEADVALYALTSEQKSTSGPWAPLSESTATSTMGRSARPRSRWDGMTLIYADLHRHSYLSRCVPENDGDVMDHLRWAMDYEEMESLCLTDHWCSQSPNQEIKSAFGLVDACRMPGRFVPMFGAEPGAWDGVDINVYWRNLDVLPEVEHILNTFQGDLPGAIEYIRDNDLVGDIVIERHLHGMNNPAWSGDLLDHPLAVAEEVEPVIEVIQNRGPSIPWYCRMLEAGQHKGVTGGSDHCRPTDRQSAGCLTGMWVEDITEEGIWNALTQRRTFATNGRRMQVRLRAQGGLMGDIISADEPVDIRWDVRAEAPVEKVTLYRDGRILKTVRPDGPHSAAGEFVDRAAGSPETSYFVVAHSADGGLVISSALWIRRSE